MVCLSVCHSFVSHVMYHRIVFYALNYVGWYLISRYLHYALTLLYRVLNNVCIRYRSYPPPQCRENVLESRLVMSKTKQVEMVSVPVSFPYSMHTTVILQTKQNSHHTTEFKISVYFSYVPNLNSKEH